MLPPAAKQQMEGDIRSAFDSFAAEDRFGRLIQFYRDAIRSFARGPARSTSPPALWLSPHGNRSLLIRVLASSVNRAMGRRATERRRGTVRLGR
jgi:hypothetical protein